MEEEPTMAAPNIEEISEVSVGAEVPNVSEVPAAPVITEIPAAAELSPEENDEFDLSDITHNPKELSKEEIIAAAEEAAFADS